MKIEIQQVHFIPKELLPGILYVSKEFGIATHLCASGCGSKVVTPLGSTEWSLDVKNNKPTLYPSIGNWQLPCQSHYWIREGEIVWADKWTPEQIVAGRHAEEERRQAYYNDFENKRKGFIPKLLNFVKGFFHR